VFADLSADPPVFSVTPPELAAGEVEGRRDRWDRFDT
jgi:hypothetical protein